MIGRAVAYAVAFIRDLIARGLVRAHVTPNALSVMGAGLTAAGGLCLAFGAGSEFAWGFQRGAGGSAWPLLAGVALLLAAACDVLDGAVARIAGSATRFGALLDSTLDRFSDFAVYTGIALAYAMAQPVNITFILLSMIAFFNAFMISYTKARAENLIRSCGVGFWQRGERTAAILIGVLGHNIPALLVQQAVLPLGTVACRIAHARAALTGRAAIVGARPGLAARLCPWRAGRGSLAYDLAVAANIAWLIFARFEPVDFLARLAD